MFTLTGILNAQWEPDVRLTNNNADSYTCNNYAHCIAANGDSVYVVWYDNRDGNNEIYFKKSSDGGINWSSDIRLTSNAGNSAYPSISISGNVIFIVWQDNRDGNNEIYYKKSEDCGNTWGSDIRLTNNIYISTNPSSVISGQSIHIIWNDTRVDQMNERVFYKKSLNTCNNWSNDTNLTDQSYSFPSISMSNNVVSLAWDKIIASGCIYYNKSENNGTNWNVNEQISGGNYLSALPSISSNGSNIYLVWEDNRTGDYSIYYSKSNNNGSNWGSNLLLTSSTAGTFRPQVFANGVFVNLVWYDYRDGNAEIYYKLSQNSGANWITDTRLTNSTGSSINPSIAVSGNTVHVVWYDNRDGNSEIYYKRNPNGNITGVNNGAENILERFSLSQNYPNPFNPTTKIKIEIPKSSFVKLIVYDVLGKEVARLVNEKLNAGMYMYDWNASNYSSGIYFYRLTSGDFTELKKMVLIK
mgnify:CR=1 FL=1